MSPIYLLAGIVLLCLAGCSEGTSGRRQQSLDLAQAQCLAPASCSAGYSPSWYGAFH
jgi:hypothetical protein